MATTNAAAAAATTTATKRGSSNSRRLILLLLTSGFFIIGLLFDYMPMIVDNQIKRTVELATNAEIQSIWSRPPVDFHSYYWLYDILNAEKFSTGEEKVRVRRVGPYHFTSRMEKRILDVSQNKFRISYNLTRHIHLDEHDSVSLDEPLVLLNPVFASLVSGSRELTRDQDAQARQMMLSSVARMADRFNETLFINTTARSALVGRRLLIVEKLLKMAETFGFEIELPSIARTKLFGYVSVMNGTWDGPFEIYSGYQASMNSLGDIISYQGKKRQTEFQGRCNRLQASAGELRPMPVHENQTLEMYQPRFCRIVHLTPTGTRKLREGLAISYELSPEDLMSAQTNADNRCFCLNNTLNNYCSLNGALEVGPCTYHSPIVITASNIKPDDRITGGVLNWDPDMLRGDIELVPKADDRGQILVLKRLGVPVQGDITLTLFMKVIRDPTFRQTSQVPEESFVPILTVRERGMIPPKLGQIIVNLESFLGLTTHLKVVMYLTAVVLLCSLTGHYYTKSANQTGGHRITPSADDNDDQASQQSGPARGGKRNSTGRAGRMLRGSRVALPASGCNSDRANSADSNRSQPPSRVSHSSLDGVSADEPAGSDQRRASGFSDSAGPAALEQQVNSRAETAKLAGQQHRIFSKVDEEAGLQSESWRAKRQANFESRKAKDTNATNGLVDSSSSSSASIAAGNRRRAGDTEATSLAVGTETATETAGANQDSSKRQPPSSKRNWFMKVCSNFVRMLNGIRSSINDAGQLEINENDYQDKQLEMLAGKIDSWYQSSPVDLTDSSLPTSSSGDNTGASDSNGAPISGQPVMNRANGEKPTEQKQRSSGAESGDKQTTTTGRKKREADEKSDIGGGSRQQRMNKEDEDDAGIGSEGEGTSAGASADETSVQLTTTNANLSAHLAPGSRVSAAPQIPARSLPTSPGPADQKQAPNGPAIDIPPRDSNSKNVSMAAKSDKAAAGKEDGKELKVNEKETSEERQPAEQSMPPMNDEEERRDSVQSYETVINKNDDNSSSYDDMSPDDNTQPMPGASNKTDNMRDGASIVKQQHRQAREVQSGKASVVVVVAASAGGEPNNELAQDKEAALDSVERALTAQSRIGPR